MGNTAKDKIFKEGLMVETADKIKLESATFRRLVLHLQENSDLQNIDLMDLAGFCRNCLAKWYKAAADEQGIELEDDEAKQIIYGMSYKQWKDKYQK